MEGAGVVVGVVRQWTGHETRLLRRAPRMTIAEFAEHLGVTTRAVDKWEARRASITPRPELQRALDTVLAGADPAVRARLLSRVDGAAHPGSPADASTPEEQPVADADAPSSVESWDLGTRAPGPSSRVPLSRDLSAGLRDVVRAPA